MAKLATIEYDEAGNVIVTHTELPPALERPPPPPHPPPSPKKRIPSSPHKPFTSSNFYDLTKSESPIVVDFVDLTKESPDVSPIVSVKHRVEERRATNSGFKELQQMDRENIIPGPFAQPRKLPDNFSSKSKVEGNAPSQGFRKGLFVSGFVC